MIILELLGGTLDAIRSNPLLAAVATVAILIVAFVLGACFGWPAGVAGAVLGLLALAFL